jgi:hypothetical protein
MGLVENTPEKKPPRNPKELHLDTICISLLDNILCKTKVK